MEKGYATLWRICSYWSNSLLHFNLFLLFLILTKLQRMSMWNELKAKVGFRMTNPIQQKNDDNRTIWTWSRKPIGYGAIPDLIYISNGGQNEGPSNTHPQNKSRRMKEKWLFFGILPFLDTHSDYQRDYPRLFQCHLYSTIAFLKPWSHQGPLNFFSNNGLAANP